MVFGGCSLCAEPSPSRMGNPFQKSLSSGQGWMDPPVEDQQETEQHAAQMGEVGHPRGGPGDSGPEFDGAEQDDEPLGLENHRWKQQHQPLVGEGHAKGQQDTEDATGGPDGRVGLATVAGHQQLHQAGADDTDEIVEGEGPGPPDRLHRRTEEPEGVHVQQQVQ